MAPQDPGEHPVFDAASAEPAPSSGADLPAPVGLGLVEARVLERFEDVTADSKFGELSLYARPSQLLELLEFCRQDPAIATEWLADVAGVHWPAGDHAIERQPSTTGWPVHRIDREQGVIEVDYILRSHAHHHWFRIVVAVDDAKALLPSATGLFPTANFLEREIFDMFGVTFEGHPNLERILMPDDWVGHPHRMDYPLGGVEISYRNDKFIPPPHEREIREVVE